MRRGLSMVWDTSRPLTLLLVASTLAAGIAPAGAAYVARIVVDAVVDASRGVDAADSLALAALALEALLVAVALLAGRGVAYGEALLRVLLAHAVHRQILDKAVTLRQSDFEDPELHDRMEESRREATVRPLSLVSRSFTLLRTGLALVGYGAILVQLSVWAVLVVVVAGIPSFLAEARFSQEAFRFFRRHSPENRERHYIETLLTREEHAKEIGFFGLGERLLERYGSLFERLYREDRRIARRRHAWGLALGLLSMGAFFGAYVWIVRETIAGQLTLGQMTMYVVVFRQGQTAVSSALAALGGIYEDSLYLDNLDEFLGHGASGPPEAEPPPRLSDPLIQSSPRGLTEHAGRPTEPGPLPGDGLRVEGLSWTYPGARSPALSDVSFHLQPGETIALVGHNGSGKSTLVKLLTRRYLATEGRIVLDGKDLRDWTDDALRTRVSVLFQDFNRYKLLAGENIGAGDPPRFDDEAGWAEAAKRAVADETIGGLPDGYRTRLGKSFRGATELSGGQWQRLALARALMRQGTDLLIFDEPTSAADPAQQAILDRCLGALLAERMGIIVSHRLASARLADRILVLVHGEIREAGTHDELVAQGGVYAELFATQSLGYR